MIKCLLALPTHPSPLGGREGTAGRATRGQLPRSPYSRVGRQLRGEPIPQGPPGPPRGAMPAVGARSPWWGAAFSQPRDASPGGGVDRRFFGCEVEAGRLGKSGGMLRFSKGTWQAGRRTALLVGAPSPSTALFTGGPKTPRPPRRCLEGPLRAPAQARRNTCCPKKLSQREGSTKGCRGKGSARPHASFPLEPVRGNLRHAWAPWVPRPRLIAAAAS